MITVQPPAPLSALEEVPSSDNSPLSSLDAYPVMKAHPSPFSSRPVMFETEEVSSATILRSFKFILHVTFYVQLSVRLCADLRVISSTESELEESRCFHYYSSDSPYDSVAHDPVKANCRTVQAEE